MKTHWKIRVLAGCGLLVMLSGADAFEEDTCADECPSYPMKSVIFPIESSQRDVSVWTTKPASVRVKFPGVEPNIDAEKVWVNFTAVIRDRKYCVAAPGYFEDTCDTSRDYLQIEVTDFGLWRFDCEGDTSCGCRKHRFLSVIHDFSDLPVELYAYPGPNVTAFNFVGKTKKIPPDAKATWHDIDINVIGAVVEVHSNSLLIRSWSDADTVVVEGIDKDGNPLPIDIAFWCQPVSKDQSLEPSGTTFVNDTTSTVPPGTTDVDNMPPWKTVLIVFVPLMIVMVIVALTLRCCRRSSHLPKAPQHKPHLPLHSVFGPPPPVPRFLEDSEEEEGVYCEIDEEALKMQLARERMGKTLLACSVQKVEEEKGREERGRGEERGMDKF